MVNLMLVLAEGLLWPLSCCLLGLLLLSERWHLRVHAHLLYILL